MKNGPRQQQKEMTRGEILSAAKALFLEHGYDATTTRQIADAAGVAVGTVFAHFADKQRLLREILSSDIEAVLVNSLSDLSEQAGAVEALLHYARHLYSYYRQQWALSCVLLKDAMFDASSYQEQLCAFVRELTGRLGVDAPSLSEDDRGVLAQCLMANYFMVLIDGLGAPNSTLEEWLASLERRCGLLVRPFRSDK